MKLVAAHEEMKRSCQEKAFTHGALVAGLGQDVPTLELLNLFTNGSGVVVSSFHLSLEQDMFIMSLFQRDFVLTLAGHRRSSYLQFFDVLTVLLKRIAYCTFEVINSDKVWEERKNVFNIDQALALF